MTEAVATERRIVRVPPVLAVGSRFGKYKPEEEKEVRKVQVKEDKVLKKLKTAWKKVKADAHRFCDDFHRDALKQVKGLDYSAKDVENFSIVLVEFQGEKYFSDKAGAFLSALINNGKDSNYVIHTGHLARAIDFLGYKNTKNMIVNGNAGHNVGHGMQDGTINVNGNAGHFVGRAMEAGSIIVNGSAGWDIGYQMINGTIIVRGNAEFSVGAKMKGGSITMSGNAGENVGDEMEGGEIRVEGKICEIGPVRGGKIYHKGKLIVDK